MRIRQYAKPLANYYPSSLSREFGRQEKDNELKGNGLYFKLYEVGTSSVNKGKSDMNRLYINEDKSITGTNYAKIKHFTVTEVRKNDSED